MISASFPSFTGRRRTNRTALWWAWMGALHLMYKDSLTTTGQVRELLTPFDAYKHNITTISMCLEFQQLLALIHDTQGRLIQLTTVLPWFVVELHRLPRCLTAGHWTGACMTTKVSHLNRVPAQVSSRRRRMEEDIMHP